MKLRIASLILLSVLFINCKNEKTKRIESSKNSSIPNDFTSFIKKFKILKVPLTIEPLKIQAENFLPLTKSDLKFIDIRDIDPDLDNVYAYGILPDTLESYKVIYLFPTEIYIPFLVTYTKTGKKISEETLSVGDCGSDFTTIHYELC